VKHAHARSGIRIVESEPSSYRIAVNGVPVGPALPTGRVACLISLWLQSCQADLLAAMRMGEIERWLAVERLESEGPDLAEWELVAGHRLARIEPGAGPESPPALEASR